MNKLETLNNIKKKIKKVTSVEELFEIRNLSNFYFLVNGNLVQYKNFNPDIMEHKYEIYQYQGKTYKLTSYAGTHGSQFSSSPSYIYLKNTKVNILRSKNIFTEKYVDNLAWVCRTNYKLIKPGQ